MALWAGTTLNNNLLASVFTQLYSKKLVPMCVKANALLYAVLGMTWQDTDPKYGVSFERLKRISGEKVEIRLMGALPQSSKVANGSAELATATPSYDNDRVGAVKFDWAHYYDVYGVPSTEYNKIEGNEAKTLDWIDETFEMISLGLENDLGNDMNGTGYDGPDDEALGNWRQAVSDGVTTGETNYATYGLDRSDSANADFRGTVSNLTGDLTLKKIRTLKNQISPKGGNSALGIGGTTVYTKVQTILEAYTVVESDPGWTQFGGEWVQYGRTKFVHEHRAPSGVLGLLDPRSWIYYEKRHNFLKSGLIPAPWLKTAYVLPWEMYAQFLCKKPNSNGILTDITS